LRRIPIVILSSSQNESDIRSAYDLQANCYVTKPADFEQFVKVVREIDAFWAVVVELPGTPISNGNNENKHHE